MQFPGNCWRCEEPGHVAAECDQVRPAATRKEHEARIARLVERWHAGRITTSQKRAWIEMENRLWEKQEKEMTGK